MIIGTPSDAKKPGLEETWEHKCGCVMRKDGSAWVKYRPCKQHEKKETNEEVK